MTRGDYKLLLLAFKENLGSQEGKKRKTGKEVIFNGALLFVLFLLRKSKRAILVKKSCRAGSSKTGKHINCKSWPSWALLFV